MPTLPAPESGRIPSRLAAILPSLLAAALAALGFTSQAGTPPAVRWTLLAASAAIIVWNALLVAPARQSRRTLDVTVVLRKQHYLQACAQGSVLLYWGWYWRPVYDAAAAHRRAAALRLRLRHAAELVAARRPTCSASVPFPVIFSINLFLWFKPDWFYLQFLMVAVGFAAKELIRWKRDGRHVHIFNPSSFPLALVLAGR